MGARRLRPGSPRAARWPLCRPRGSRPLEPGSLRRRRAFQAIGEVVDVGRAGGPSAGDRSRVLNAYAASSAATWSRSTITAATTTRALPARGRGVHRARARPVPLVAPVDDGGLPGAQAVGLLDDPDRASASSRRRCPRTDGRSGAGSGRAVGAVAAATGPHWRRAADRLSWDRCSCSTSRSTGSSSSQRSGWSATSPVDEEARTPDVLGAGISPATTAASSRDVNTSRLRSARRSTWAAFQLSAVARAHLRDRRAPRPTAPRGRPGAAAGRTFRACWRDDPVQRQFAANLLVRVLGLQPIWRSGVLRTGLAVAVALLCGPGDRVDWLVCSCRRCLLDPRARHRRLENWSDYAAAAVGAMRYEVGRHPSDRRLAGLVDDLRASADAWTAAPLAGTTHGPHGSHLGRPERHLPTPWRARSSSASRRPVSPHDDEQRLARPTTVPTTRDH